MALFLQQILNGLVIGSTYAVVAIGFSLVFSVQRVINFAHPNIFMVGMFGGLMAGIVINDNFFVVLLGGAFSAGVAGLILERTILRPLMGRDVLMTLMGTLGVAIAIENGVAAAAGPDPLPFLSPLPKIALGGETLSLSLLQLVTFSISLLLLAGMSYYVRMTRFGRATRAIAEKPDVAAAFGVDVSRVSQVTVVLASAMAGVAGVAVGMLYGNAWAYVGLLYGLKAFICMLVAGNRYFEGIILIAFVLGIAEALITSYLSSTLRDAIAFGLLIVVLYLRPNGLFGSYA